MKKLAEELSEHFGIFLYILFHLFSLGLVIVLYGTAFMLTAFSLLYFLTGEVGLGLLYFLVFVPIAAGAARTIQYIRKKEFNLNGEEEFF